MKTKIAIVSAFSELCIPLVKQFVVSCLPSIKQYSDVADFTFFLYECNWVGDKEDRNYTIKWRGPVKRTKKPFYKFDSKISIKDELNTNICQFVQIDASDLSNEYSWLPDIVTYQDFCDNHMKNFDYVLFAHDDIIINNKLDIFAHLVRIIETDPFKVCCIADTHLECFNYISARIYPHFVFVKKDIFFDLNMSWANHYNLFDTNIKTRDIYNDGGGGLLASIYQIGNKDFHIKLPEKHWFHHLRLSHSSVGVETAIINNGFTEEALSLMEHAEKYIARNLWL